MILDDDEVKVAKKGGIPDWCAFLPQLLKSMRAKRAFRRCKGERDLAQQKAGSEVCWLAETK